MASLKRFVSAQVLEVLWELAHLPTLPTSLVQQALEEHLGILSDAYAVKETVKRSYIIKCIEDIKKVRATVESVLVMSMMGNGRPCPQHYAATAVFTHMAAHYGFLSRLAFFLFQASPVHGFFFVLLLFFILN